MTHWLTRLEAGPAAVPPGHSSASAGPGLRGVPSCRADRPRQVPDPHQVVDRHREGEHPADTPHAPVPRLPGQGACLGSPEDLFLDLPLSLTDGVAGMPGRARIEGA